MDSGKIRDRGKLDRLTGEISEWQVEAAQIRAINESLVAAGLVFDWRSTFDFASHV